MIANDLPSVNPNVDYTKILPIQQKRMIAFVNHFIMNWVSYLNSFAQSCESRFIQFEYKIQKVEASLMILESQLSSVNGLEISENNNTEVPSDNAKSNNDIESVDLPDIPITTQNNEDSSQAEEQPIPEENGIKAKDDPRFSKFFKMLHVGVPLQAVKLKMQSEGVDQNILDNPDRIIPET